MFCENAYKHLKYLLKKCTSNNLFDIHPPFQIDWNKGSVKGIRARGNLTFDISWEDSILKNAAVTAENDCTFRIKLNDKTKNLKANKPYTIEDNCLITELSAGETIELSNCI